MAQDFRPLTPDHTPARGAQSHASGRSPKAGIPHHGTLSIGHTDVLYTVRVSVRAQRISLRISPAKGLEVVLPRGVAFARAESLLREKSAWIVRTLARMPAAAAEIALPPLVSGRELVFAGRPLTLLIHDGAPAGRFRAALSGATLELTVHSTADESVRHALETWYRRQASAVFAERLQVCNARYGFTYARVSIKEQKSRWGSCSRRGNLNFNWRLLLAPLPVLDYVVVHELAHLKRPDHSPAFWALVASACPAYGRHRSWLRAHGHELRF